MTHPDSRHPKDYRTIHADGHSFGYHCEGSGPDVLLIHGWPLNMQTWVPLLPHLQSFRVHRVDLPGFGGGRWNLKTPLTYPRLANSLAALIDQISLQNFSLIGHNSGGLLARYLAANYGERINALIVAGSEIPNEYPWQIRWIFKPLAHLPFAGMSMNLVLKHRLIRNSPLGMRGVLQNMSRLEDGEFFERAIKPLLASPDTRHTAMAYWRFLKKEHIDQLRELHTRILAPTLLVWGKACPFFPAAKAARLPSQFTNTVAHLMVLEHASLYVHEDLPHDFGHLCRTFLRDHMTSHGDGSQGMPQ